MQGYNSLVWGVIILQAVGGLVVAAVFLKEFWPDEKFLLGTIFVLCATSVYNLGLPDFLITSTSAIADWSSSVKPKLFLAGTMLVLSATLVYNLGLPDVLEWSSSVKLQKPMH